MVFICSAYTPTSLSRDRLEVADTRRILESLREDRDKIVAHVSCVEQLRKDQLEAENLLDKFLHLKNQASSQQTQDRDALRLY